MHNQWVICRAAFYSKDCTYGIGTGRIGGQSIDGLERQSYELARPQQVHGNGQIVWVGGKLQHDSD
jgi:hypothetical protein